MAQGQALMQLVWVEAGELIWERGGQAEGVQWEAVHQRRVAPLRVEVAWGEPLVLAYLHRDRE